MRSQSLYVAKDYFENPTYSVDIHCSQWSAEDFHRIARQRVSLRGYLGFLVEIRRFLAQETPDIHQAYEKILCAPLWNYVGLAS